MEPGNCPRPDVDERGLLSVLAGVRLSLFTGLLRDSGDLGAGMHRESVELDVVAVAHGLRLGEGQLKMCSSTDRRNPPASSMIVGAAPPQSLVGTNTNWICHLTLNEVGGGAPAIARSADTATRSATRAQ